MLRYLTIYFTICILILLVWQTSSAQNQGRVDSLLRVLDTQIADTAKFYTYHRLADAYWRTERKDSMQMYWQKAESLVERIDFDKGRAVLLRQKGLYFNTLGNFDSARVLYQQSMNIYQSLGDSLSVSLLYNDLAGAYFFLGNYDKAIASLLNFMNVQQQLGNKEQIAKALNNMALIYKESENYEKALETNLQSLAIKKELNNQLSVAASLINIGNIYKLLGQQDKALASFEEGLQITREEAPNSRIMGQMLVGIAELILDKKEVTKAQIQDAEIYFKQIEDIAKSSQDQRLFFYTQRGMAKCELIKGNYSKASMLFDKAIDLANAMGLRKEIKDIILQKARLYEITNQLPEANKMLNRYIALNDSLYKEQNLKEINRLQAVYESESKEQLIAIYEQRSKAQQAELESQLLGQYLLIGGSASLLIILILLIRRGRERRKQEQRILIKNEEINKQKEEISKQNKAVNLAYEKLSVLNEIGQNITSSINLEELITRIYANIDAIMPAKGFGIGIYSERTGRLEFPGFIENGKELPFHSEAVNDEQYLSAISFRENREIIINNVEEEYYKYTGKHISNIVGELPKSLIYIPLRNDNKVIGVMTVQSFKQNAYSAEHIGLLRSLASYISIAVANANAYKIIEDKNTSITDSIRYARTIQQAMLPQKEKIARHFEEHFILYKPRDLVSGDFYWFHALPNTEDIILLNADCTGHGIPGAFMSMIGNMLLQDIVVKRKVIEPHLILAEMHQSIKVLLKQKEKGNLDGMDIGICHIKKQVHSSDIEIDFAGAKRPLYYYTQTEGLKEIKGDSKSIGGGRTRNETYTFQIQKLKLKKGDSIYLTTDGFVDQNAPDKMRIGSAAFKKFLAQHAQKKMAEQKQLLEQWFYEHSQGIEQRDDISIVGVRL
ncbi:MAG: tetratricopeptide repeat protein [Bernardetiaceae bacterium]|nr:tetratricopeptide repeat protein [Bernardetiaceae bacterium]